MADRPDPAAPGLPSWQAQVSFARLVGVVAISCSLVVALTLPAGYFWLSYGAEQREGQVAARLHAAFITQVIAQSQGDWRADVGGLIESDLSPGELPEQRTLTDLNGVQLSTSGVPVAGPLLTTRAELIGREGRVGEVAVHRSLRPLLLRTAAVGGVGLMLGLVIFLSLRLLRRRALERATQAVRHEEALAREKIEQSLQVVFGHAIDGIVMTKDNGDVVSANPAAEKLLGRTTAQLLGHPLAQCLVAVGEEGVGALSVVGQSEARVVRPDGTSLAVDVTINEAGSDVQASRIVMIRDISERKRQEVRLARLANFDALTGLPNRSQFMHKLRQAMGRAQRQGRSMALMFLDLDRFKVVNDSLGHHVGDQLLRRVAKLLTAGLRQGDSLTRRDSTKDVYRLGGDEFTVILEDLDRGESAAKVAARLISLLERPLVIDGNLLYVSSSIGIAHLEPGDTTDVETLVKQADMAMYRAKEVARGSYQFFSAELGSRAKARQEIEVGLRGALERGEFSLHYQPKADLSSGRVTGVEALLRWHRPGQPAIGPDRFVPVLEEIGLIVPVGLWVLREACRQVAQWNRAGPQALSVAVNISSRQFHQPDLADQIGAALRDAGLDAQLLEIELTESMLVEDSESVLRILRGITALGVRVAIDDFGTGHSSLSYLRRFDIDTLKIDRSFVRDTPGDPEDCAIAVAVIALGHGLNLRVVAEGVETQEQASFLREQGCDDIQGYLLSKPMAPEEFPGWMARHIGGLQFELSDAL
jgi:diguanylate cyclase (GGDEF)-like protein/PAS domain S-box-containing protein